MAHVGFAPQRLFTVRLLKRRLFPHTSFHTPRHRSPQSTTVNFFPVSIFNQAEDYEEDQCADRARHKGDDGS